MPSGRLCTFIEKHGGLIIVFGQYGSGKTTLLQKWTERYGYPYLPIGSLLSERTIGCSRAERPDAVQREFQTLVESTAGDVILCDNLDLLFASDLSLDPLRLLEKAARKKTIVAAWNGPSDGSTLSYAIPGHDEYRVYSPVDLVGVTLSSVNQANVL